MSVFFFFCCKWRYIWLRLWWQSMKIQHKWKMCSYVKYIPTIQVKSVKLTRNDVKRAWMQNVTSYKTANESEKPYRIIDWKYYCNSKTMTQWVWWIFVFRILCQSHSFCCCTLWCCRCLTVSFQNFTWNWCYRHLRFTNVYSSFILIQQIVHCQTLQHHIHHPTNIWVLCFTVISMHKFSCGHKFFAGYCIIGALCRSSAFERYRSFPWHTVSRQCIQFHSIWTWARCACMFNEFYST